MSLRHLRAYPSLLILVLLPSYLIRFSLFSIALNLLDVFIIGTFLIFLVREHQYITLGKWKYIMAAFVLIGGSAVLASTDLFAALGLYKSYIVLPVLLSIMLLTLRPPLYQVLYALSLAVLFLAIVGGIQYFTGYGIPAPWIKAGDDFRITSIYDYPNALGLFLAPVLAMFVAWAIHVRQHHRWFLYLSVIGFLVIVLARSDGAILALATGIIACMLFTPWRWLMVGATALLMTVAIFWAPSREVILLQDTSGEVRLALWEGTLQLLTDRPLLGAGLAGFPQLYQEYKLDRHVELLLYPHNIVLDFWVELGLAGVMWLVFVLVIFFRNLQRSQSPQAIVLLCGMVALLIYGLVDVPYFKNDLAVLFWTILTMSEVVKSKA